MTKTCIRLTRGIGAGLPYYMGLPLYELREMVDIYVEVLREDGR